MRRSRIPAIRVHLISGSDSVTEAGSFFTASPMISRLRTTARRKTSSDMNSAWVVLAAARVRNAASSRMCRRYSRGSDDILGSSQDVRPDVWAQSLRCHQFDPPPQMALEDLAELHERVERFRSRRA